MKYYFKKFTKQKIQTEPDEFVWLLYFVYCSLIEIESKGGNIWDRLKQRIKDFKFEKRTISRIKGASNFLLRNLGASSANGTSTQSTSKLKSLQIKNFRGFGSAFNEDDKGVHIEFNNNNTIFYGPNGSGKSSLCDALEYKLTGQVREASRRNKKVNDYVKRIGSPTNPELMISFVDAAINREKLSEDEKKFYTQAFIEKNRIQEFSLFGSKDTGIKKEQILSILIGMDDLSDLAKAFVQPAAFKTNLLSFKRNVVADKISLLNAANVSNTTLKKTYEDAIKATLERADVILAKTGATIPDLEEELLKVRNAIAETNSDTLSLSSSAAIHQQTKLNFEDVIQKLQASLRKYDEMTEQLAAAKTDLSFLNLYTAVEELQNVVTDTCPACDTPLSNVNRNPFLKASDELVKLKSIKEQELAFNAHKQVVEENLKSLELLHNNFVSNTTDSDTLRGFVAQDSVLSSKSPQYSLTARDLIDTNVDAIKSQILTLENYFLELGSIQERQTQRQERVAINNDKISQLNERRSVIESIRNNWQDSETKLAAVIVSLETYLTELGALNSEKVGEDSYNGFIDSLVGIYPSFYEQLQTFKDNEFQTRFGKLESEIAGFYTQINRHDSEHEIVELFRINNSDSDYKIEFRVKGSTEIEDASLKFSEGHLRSLGLSILLANAKINALPFIIFDDVVNAIDSDHRSNIIDMMVKDPYLMDVQQIVSTHDRLYWERFSLENQKLKFSSYILKYTKEGVVHYPYKVSFKEKIQDALDHFDIRQALLYCRIWLETIAKQFCMENNIELTGTLKSTEFHVSVEPTLGTIYRVLGKTLIDNEHLNILLRDEINYKGLNQEHHSFDEFNFNFIHSRTSQDVQKIFDAVIGLDDDIRFIKNHVSMLDKLIESYRNRNQKVGSMNVKMPLNIQQDIIDRYHESIERLQEFSKRMIKLRMSIDKVKIVERKISNVLLGGVVSSLLRRQV